MSSLEILFPESKTITIAGSKVTIKPIALEHFELFGRASSSLIEMLSSAGVQQINRYAATHAAELRQVLKVSTSLGWRQRRRLPAAVAVQVMVAVVRENASFFGEALPRMVEALNGAMSSSD
jgi:hypothetical protein